MDKQVERKDDGLKLPKETQINLVMNKTQTEEVTIDLVRVFQRFKEKTRVFIWLLLFGLVAGISAGLLLWQTNQKPLMVASVVTLRYKIDMVDPKLDIKEDATEKNYIHAQVMDLTSPDGKTELDLSQISSSYVLQNALQGIELSKDISLSALQKQIAIQRIPTEEVRRQQELISSMMGNTATVSDAYTRAQELEILYTNQFIVSLTNGFGDEKNGKVYLEDEEIRVLLDRILIAYNDYLVKNYGQLKAPSDEISVIDINALDTMESLDLLRGAMGNLITFCKDQEEEIRTYRSWKTGATLEELERKAELAQDVNLEHLYAHIYANGLVRGRESMLSIYQYELRTAEADYNKISEDIAAAQKILDTYKNDQILVTTQESEAAKSTNYSTEYYNELVLAQAENHKKAAELQTTISDLQGKIEKLTAVEDTGKTEDVSGELQQVFAVCEGVYKEISDHISEILQSPSYRIFADASAAQGESESFISGSMKNMITFGAVGAVLVLVLWFISALIPEFRRRDEEKEKQDKPEKEENGKGAAEA